MAFRLQEGEVVASGIRRIAAEQLASACEHLQSDGGDQGKHVHEARKSMKRLRAVVRLVRGALGEEIYRLENACYRDAARQLSGVRDATALVEALEALVRFAGPRVRRGRFITVARWLEERRAVAHARHGDDEQLRHRVLTDLRWAERRVREWPLSGSGSKAAQRGMRRIYARGRRGYLRALAEPRAEVLHQWRKSVKYLWYHAQILRDVWPGMMARLGDELDELGDVLGQDHDLSVLRQTIMTEMSRPIRATTLQALLALIEEQQEHLRGRAYRLGRRLYVERPRAFARRMRGYWRAWQAEKPAPAVAAPCVRPEPRAAHPELVADCHCHTAEGPLWHPLEKCLYWVDIPQGRLLRYVPASDTHEQCYEAGEALGGFTIQADGSLLLFMAGGAVRSWRGGELHSLIDAIPAEHDSRFNDVIADPAGRVFCGTMPGKRHPARLYRLDTNGALTTVLGDVGLANGLGFSPDRRTLYFTDSKRQVIRRFEYDELSGGLRAPRVLVDTSGEPGVPDGMTVDAEGCVWSARWDGGCVIRYSPEGEELRRIELPARKVSCVTFGGEDQRDMYVTTAGGQDGATDGTGAGGVFRLRVGVRGLPEYLSRIGP